MAQFRTTGGQVYDIPEERREEALQAGLSPVSDQELDTLATQEEEKDRPVAAFGAGAARRATFGLSDLALTKTGLSDPEHLRALKQENPTATTMGETAGSLATAAVAPVGVASFALQGAAGAVGRHISEHALGEDKNQTAEEALLSLGKDVLFDAAVGGALGAGGKLISRGGEALGQRAGSILDRGISKAAERGNISEELVRKAISREGKPVREILGDSDKAKALLEHHIEQMGDGLYEAQTRLEDLATEPGAPAEFTNRAGQYAAEADAKARWLDNFIYERDLGKKIIDGSVKPGEMRSLLDDLKATFDRTNRLREHAGLAPLIEPMAPELAEALELRAAMNVPKKAGQQVIDETKEKILGMGRKAAGAALGAAMGGPLGHLGGAYVGKEILGGLGQAVSTGARVLSDPLEAMPLLHAIDTLGGRAQDLAFRAMDGVLGAPQVAGKAIEATGKALASRPSAAVTMELVRRADQISSDPDAAKRNIMDRMGPAGEHAPLVAQAMADHAIQAATYLSSVAPRAPGPDPLGIWRPSVSAVETFHRAYDAVTNPRNVLERLANGQPVLPSEVEAVAATNPALLRRMSKRLMDRVSQDPSVVPPSKRWLFEKLTGIRLDPLQPQNAGQIGAMAFQPRQQPQAPKTQSPAQVSKYLKSYRTETDSIGQ